MPDISVKNLTFVYHDKRLGDVVALDDVSVSFDSGKFNCIVGPSGCGKTTLLRCIAGLEGFDGSILFDNTDVSSVKPSDRDLAFVFQEYVLYPHMTTFDNIAFPLKNAGAPRAEIIARVKEVADILDLGLCLTRRPRHLSGGQQQRVALARALVKRPSVCLLDEPLSNVDAQARIRERRYIKQATAVYGCTCIYVTHDFYEAMALSDRLIVMSEGKVVEAGAPLDVYRSENEIVRFLSSNGDKQW